MSNSTAKNTYVIGQLYYQIKNTKPQTVTFVPVRESNGKYVSTGGEDIILTDLIFEHVTDGHSSGNHINGFYLVNNEKKPTHFYDYQDFFYKNDDREQKYLAKPDYIQPKPKGFFNKLIGFGGRRSRRSRKSKRMRRGRSLRTFTHRRAGGRAR